MPRSPALAGATSLFVPTYALWEEPSPLPSFAHLAAFATTARRLDIDVVATLPLYAAFLDDPFDPSPYAPVSRLHWNELYLDDATLPAAPVPEQHTLLDWRQLAARRRAQLLDAARDLDPYIEAGIDRFVARRPDVVDFARFRALHPDAVDSGAPTRARRAQPPPRPVPRRPPARRGRGRRARRAGARPADRQPRRRLRELGPR